MRAETLILMMLIAVVVLAAAGIGIGFAVRKARSQKLREKFGNEYDYTVEKEGDWRTAEEILLEREKRVTNLDIHELNESTRERYHHEWDEIQASFVDDPSKAIAEANRLITEVMIARGFPVADFEQRAADLSVIYPEFVSNYRNANAIALKNQSNETTTEDLRQAMVYYRSLFEVLLGTAEAKEVEAEEKELVTK